MVAVFCMNFVLGLVSKLYPSNMSRMLNKDLPRFRGLSRVQQNQASKRKALVAG